MATLHPVTASAATDVSGTVSYSGSKSPGRVYLTMFTSNGPMGTSIPAPGAFTIRGVPTGSYILTAFMDTLGTGSRHESDPSGTSPLISVVTAPVTGVSIAMTDPVPLTTVLPPSGLRVFPADGGALISWNQYDVGNGSQADSYSVYWDTTPGVSIASPNSKLDIPASGDKTDLLLGGIANGTYYFIITAKSGAVTSSPSTAFGPVTIGPAAGGFSISGTVTFPAVANGKPLFLAIGDMTGNMYPAYINSAATPQSYTVSGVPNGLYRVYAVIDVDNNGQIGIGDYKTNDSNAPTITVNNSAVSNVDLTLGSQNGSVNVMTAHWKNGTVDSYYLNFEVSDGLKKPVAVTLNSGPNVTGPIDMGMNSGGGFFSMIGIGSTVPAVNDTYLFDVIYSDNTTDTNLSTAITGVINDFATPVAPVGSVSYSAAPTFSWTAPATPPVNGGYSIFLSETNGTIGSVQWDSNQIPLSQTSVVFNFDNRATQPSLTNAKSYDWGIMVFDQQRNYSASFASFAFPGSAGISPTSMPSAIVGSSYFQQLTASGGNGSYSWSITTGLLPDGLTLDTATGIISGTPTTAGTSNFTVQAADNATTPFVISLAYSITVFPVATNFSVTASAGPSTSGFISPAGTVSVASGASQTFNITPFTGYHISDVMVDGISQGVISTYTFSNVTANHTIDALFAPDSTVATITGTINYTGSNTGLIYITLQTPNGTLGTSIATPGTYTIRGVPNGTYTINAFMDNLNLGTQVQSSPAGSFTANISGSNVAGLDIGLVDQTPQAPAAPVNVSVAPGDGSVMISWDPARGANGVEAADTYDIFWGPTATVSSTNNSGSKINIPAGLDSPVVIESLTNGSSLFFSVVPKSGGVIGSSSPAIGPVTINPTAGGNTVSGTVTYSGSTPTGPLYVILVDPLTKGITGAFYTKIAAPSFSNTFSISGAPNGSYMLYAIVDQNSDGRFGAGDTGLTSYGAPPVTLTGGGASGISITLNEMNTEANITTNHGKPASGTGEWFNVNGEIGNQLKRAVKVSLTSAPAYMQLSLPLDLGLRSEGGRFNFWGNATTRPTIGDTFSFLVSYADATPDATITASVTGVLDSFPAFLQVSSPVTTVPTFTWGAPLSTPPANYLYSLWVGGINGGNLWEAWDIPASTTSMVYGSTGSTPQPLAVSTTYNAAVSVKDLLGNQAQLNTNFTPTQTVATTTYSIAASAAPAIGGFISPPGTTQVTSGAAEIYFITPNPGYHVADVKVDGASQGAITSYSFTNVTANHTIDVIFAIDTIDISGTISYTGSNSGRIYIAVDTNQGILGTSIAAPGAYTIRGLPNGTFPVRVFMDSLNLGTRVQSSPAGSSTVTISGASVTLPDIAITDQPAVTPPAPFGVSASPGNGSVIIDWDKDRPNGVESADSYDIYWDTSAAVSSTAFKGKRTGIPAGFDSPAVIDGLINGDKLYFIAIASSGGLQSGPSIPFGPVTVGTPTGGNSVSGTLTYSGLTPTGPLHIAVVSPMTKGAKGVYFTTIPSPTASNSFTVNGVPDGEYVIYSIIDMNNDKLFGSGDVMTPDNQAPMIQVAGAPLSGIALSLNAMTAESSIRTDHHFSGAVEFFNLEGQIRGQIKRPVMVTVTAAPSSNNLALPMDLGLDTKDGSGNFRFWTGTPNRPNVGDSYTFSVTYSDGSTDSALTASVTGVNDSFPTNPQISAPVTTVPTFSWGAPAAPPANYRYSLWAWTNNNNIWDAWDLPKSMNTIAYGATGSMAQPLQIGITYNWDISTVDQNGNRASVSNSFIPTNQGTPLIFWPTPPVITLGTALSASELNATASVPGTFSYTPAAGTVLSVGAQTLTATFTPTDITNFVSATATVTLSVNPVITSTAGTGGTITPIGATVITAGSSQAYAITATTGYHIADVKVDGVSQGAIATYTFNSVTANQTIDATFAIDTFTITATAGTGGTIAPAGATIASYGSNQAYAITPATGYHIADVKVDGISQGAVVSYTFNSVAANHTIDATFAIDTFTITATANTGGTITPAGATVAAYSSSQAYAITPTTGYHIADVKVDGVSQGAIVSYTFTNITAIHTIDATFAIDTFTITATAGTGGTIAPAGATVASYGSNQAYAITPTTGYHIADVKVNGVSQGAVASYTFNSVTANHAIDVTFAIDTFTITATANTGGTITPLGATTLNYGTSQSYTITPDAGFVLIDVRVDQVSAGKVNSYPFNNLTSGHTIEAVFGADGVVDPTNTTGVPQLGDALVVLTAALGDATLTPAQLKKVDTAPIINGIPQPDGKVDMIDVLIMLRRVVGLEKW